MNFYKLPNPDGLEMHYVMIDTRDRLNVHLAKPLDGTLSVDIDLSYGDLICEDIEEWKQMMGLEQMERITQEEFNNVMEELTLLLPQTPRFVL